MPLVTKDMFTSKRPALGDWPAGAADTQDGAEWLTCVTDPYHDYNLRIAGIPADDASMSYMRQFKERVTITKPTGFPAGNFDVHVFFSDVMSTTTVKHAKRVVADEVTYSSSGTIGTMGFITYVCVPSGSPVTDPAAVWTSIDISPGPNTPYRVTSAGFEVHNVTAELYRSGACTTWRSNPCRVTEFASVDSDPPQRIDFTSGVPGSVEIANMLPTSRTWRAAEGCLVVAQPNFSDMGFHRAVQSMAALELSAHSTYSDVVLCYNDIALEHSASYPSGYTPAGAIFTGLSPESVLTLDTRVYLESAPSLDPQLLALCSPGGTYDAAALATARRLFSLMPPGTEVKNNDLGKWFRNILSIAKRVLPAVATVVPHAGAKSVLSAVGAGAGALHSALTGLAGAGRMSQKGPAKDLSVTRGQRQIAPRSRPATGKN